MSLKGDVIAIAIGGAVLLAAGWYAKKKAADAADALMQGASDAWETAQQAVSNVLPYVNPADEKNIVNQGATKLLQTATGTNDSIGGYVYDLNHGGALTNVQWWQWANPATVVGTVAGDATVSAVKNWWNSL